jgi:hypothetical protein
LEGVDEPDTRELRLAEEERERDERRQADVSAEDAETRTHERRADKHSYLREKLAEREKSEGG